MAKKGLYKSGVVQIGDYFSIDTTNSKGSGCIENIIFDGGNVNVDALVNRVTADVQAWLNTKDYNTASEVLDSGSKTDISSLLAIYQNVDYSAIK